MSFWLHLNQFQKRHLNQKNVSKWNSDDFEWKSTYILEIKSYNTYKKRIELLLLS